MKKSILLILFLLVVTIGFAQNKITGIVMNSKSEPLAGVSVKIKGTNNIVPTDINGHYSINAQKGDIINFSFIGMIDNSVTYTNQKTIDVKMIDDEYAVGQVVVIGYGSTKKSDLTGSVGTVKPEGLKNSKVGMVSGALQGMAAGVQVTQGNMKPGADAGIIIRGAGSINAGTAPLYIVDGVPVSGLQDISTSDVESMEILKDASAASIYGSRGSNGVVLITTKRGEAGKNRVSFNTSFGAQRMMNKQNLMNAQQYYNLVEASGQAYTWTAEELRLLSRGESTDWQDAITQQGGFQNHSLSVSGGNKDITHFLGVDYYDQTGIIKNSSFDKVTVRYNMDSRINNWVRSGLRFNIVESNLKNINEESDSGYGTLFSAVSSQPTAPIYASNGKYFDGFLNTKANPVAIVELLDKSIKKTKAITSLFFEFEPVKNLKIKSDNAADLTFYRQNEYEDGRMGQHYTKDGHATIMSNKERFVQTENTINYDFKRDEYNLNLMGGFSASKTEYEEGTADAKGLSAITKYNNLGAATNFGPNSSYACASTLTSFYTRATLNYNERYLATFTMRSDGSSRFAPGHRWGYFPSMALAWKVSEEDFMDNASSLNNLKIRLSAGMLGNQNIGDYAYAALVSQGGPFVDYTFGNSKNTGAMYSSISNPNLTWEKAKQLDLGVDFGFFGNRIAGTIDGYYKRTSDLLWSVPLPYESGYISSLTNVGVLDNKGIELSLNTVNISNTNFQWLTSFNVSYNKNNIVELYDGKKDVNKTLFVGHSISAYYLLKSDGIWQANESTEAAKYGCIPGDRKVADIKKDGVINGDDRTFSGESTPKYFGGLTNTLKFRNFDFIILMTYAGGHKINNTLLRFLNSYNTWGNMSVDYYNNYWTPERSSNKYPAPRIGSPYSNGDGTDANLERGDYLRLKNIELGYTLPKKITDKFKASSVRAYVSVQNLYTLTEFTGYDVEAWDNTNPYPAARCLIGGLSINF